MMEHVFTEIARPVSMHILSIARPVHKYHCRAAALESRRLVESSRYLGAVARRELHYRRIDPVVAPKIRRRGGCHFYGLCIRPIFLKVYLWRLVAVGVDQRNHLLVGREKALIAARH